MRWTFPILVGVALTGLALVFAGLPDSSAQEVVVTDPPSVGQTAEARRPVAGDFATDGSPSILEFSYRIATPGTGGPVALAIHLAPGAGDPGSAPAGIAARETLLERVILYGPPSPDGTRTTTLIVPPDVSRELASLGDVELTVAIEGAPGAVDAPGPAIDLTGAVVSQ